MMFAVMGTAAAAGLAIIGALSGSAEWLMLWWLALAVLCAFAYWAVRGDLLSAVLLWFATVICLHEEFWRQPDVFLFALTVPRVLIVVLCALFVVMLALGRFRLRVGRPVGAAIVALAAYFTVSAIAGGFETRSPVSIHYRLIGGYLFPFAVFWLTLHGLRTARDFRRISVFFAAVAVYLTWTGWCEQFRLFGLVWPGFIGDPSVGLHWGRVRGPFVSSPAMGLALVFCFFNNLVLARQSSLGRRWLLISLDVLMLPVIFWTRTRSVWLAMILALVIWVVYARRRITRVVTVSVLAALVLSVAVVNMQNFLSERRAKGGLTDIGPILLRIGLARVTAEMVRDHPLTGLGFGHFRDAAPHYGRDPSSPYLVYTSAAMEHNNLLSIVAETGVIGLALYVLVFIILLRLSIRLFHRLPAGAPGPINRDLIVLYWILFAAFFVDGMFRETSNSPFANSLMFGLSAMIVALQALVSPAPLPSIRGRRPRHHGPTSTLAAPRDTA